MSQEKPKLNHKEPPAREVKANQTAPHAGEDGERPALLTLLVGTHSQPLVKPFHSPCVHVTTCVGMFIVALLLITPNWK